MPTDLLHILASNAWAWLLIVLFFGGSIFVHELGHFLAARWRGVHVERFSIGFGPKIFSWRRGGVEYCLSWIPLGGYVLLPQLADLSAIEGTTKTDVSKLPPIGYASKVIVFVAGAVFNILFAFTLACVVWLTGLPASNDQATTRIGYITATIDETNAPSPATLAGLHIGDRILAIDGHKISDWSDLVQTLIMSSGRGTDGQPQSIFTIEREGRTFNVTVHPRLSGDDKYRRVGIAPAYDLIVHEVQPDSLGQKTGLLPGDQLLRLDETPVLNIATLQDYLAAHRSQTVALHILRNQASLTLTLPPRPDAHDDLGLDFSAGSHITHPSPFTQIADNIRMTFRTLGSLLNPHSDIGFSKLTGPVGIVHIFHMAATEAGLPAVLMFTILINVNLAIINLLPVPVLDGGHILIATIGKLRGRAIPFNIVATMTSVFIVLILTMILYMSFSDVRHWVRDIKAENEIHNPPAQSGK